MITLPLSDGTFQYITFANQALTGEGFQLRQVAQSIVHKIQSETHVYNAEMFKLSMCLTEFEELEE